MKTLGIISDTHGLFDPQLKKLFAQTNAILHAGDVCGQSVLRELSALAPVEAIQGNCDLRTDTHFLPPHSVVSHWGWRILIIHDLGRPERPKPGAAALIRELRPEIVVYGHSHRGLVAAHGGLLFLNPGSAGKRRFRLTRTAILLQLRDQAAHAVLHSLELPSLPAIASLSFPRGSLAKLA